MYEAVGFSGKKDFPKGFNGVITLFNQYFRVLDKQFGRIRPEYKYKKVVSTSVKLLAIPVFEAKYNLLKITVFNIHALMVRALFANLVRALGVIKIQGQSEQVLLPVKWAQLVTQAVSLFFLVKNRV